MAGASLLRWSPLLLALGFSTPTGLIRCNVPGDVRADAAACGWSRHVGPRKGTYRRDDEGRVHRFDVRPGDRWVRESARNPTERSELQHDYRVPFGADLWFSFDLTILSGLPTDARWTVLGQLHQTSNPGDRGGSPPFAQYYYPGRGFLVQIRASDERPLVHNPRPRTVFADPGFAPGRHYRFAYRLRYDPRDGALDGWRDGRRIIRYRGPLGYPGRVGPYLKFGIYRAPAGTPMQVEYRDIRIGRRAADVAAPPGAQRSSRDTRQNSQPSRSIAPARHAPAIPAAPNRSPSGTDAP